MLTAKEEKFSVNVFSGMTLTDAYKDAYDAENMKDETIYVKASELMKKDKIRVRVQQLRDEANNSKIISAIRRKEILTEIVNVETNVDSRMKAIDLLNKMDGEYIQKVQADVDNHIDINIEIDDVDE